MKKFRNMKLFPKTFCYLLALFGVVILILQASIYFILPKVYLKEMERDLDRRLDSLCGTVAAVAWEDCGPIFTRYAVDNGINLSVRVGEEKLLYQGTPLQLDLNQEMTGDYLRLDGVEGMEFVLFKHREVTSRDGYRIKIQMSANTQPVRQAVRLILFLLPLTSVASVAAAVLFAYLYSKKLTRPIREMLRAAERMEALDRDAAVAVETGDELGMLAERINHLYRELWRTIHSLEEEKAHIVEMEQNKVNFLRSASHELKTPLAGLRILLENMKYNVGRYKDHDTYLQEGLDTVDRLTAMVRDILEASRVQPLLASEPVSLAEEVAVLWADYALLARSRGLAVEIDVDEALTVEMDPTLLRRVLSNLLSNAVRYTEEGGRIAIRGAEGQLSVWNACAPLTEEQSARVFEAFYRPDFARSAADGGSGLGLYLVREILEAHRLPYAFAPDGAGMRFTLWLTPSEDRGA